ncbi:ATP-binding protein [Acinetobacter sp. MD2(2019)]|nr:ATP-binding protein [Acinetobacter sp. MD2(2019)]
MNNINHQTITKGLKTIYLHNSYIRNKRVKLQCDGHTNLIAANGRGKTSMLNLLPIFAGVSPESMVQKAANKSSFLDFYLPNLQSMIVFEYRGQQGVCCVVMYRHQNGSKFIYRFVQGRAEDTLFSPQLSELFEKNTPVNEIFHELQLNDIKVSRQIETILDYRAILHNDKERFARDKMLRNLAADYAMCERQYTLRHLGELTRVPMSHVDLIHKFKSMLVDAYLQDENVVVANKGLTHTSNLNLIEDMRSLQQFIKSSSQLEKGTQLRTNVIQTYQQLLTVKLQGEMLTEQLIGDEQHLQQLNDAYLEKYEHNYHDLQTTISDLATQLSSKQGERTTTKNQIEHINKQEEEYQQLNINHMIKEYDNLPVYQLKLQEEKTQLQRLEASANDIVDYHNLHINQIRDETSREKDLWEQKKGNIHHEQIQLLKQQSQEEEELRSKQNTELTELSSRQAFALDTILKTIQQAYRSVGEAAAYTAEELQHLDLNKKLLKQQKQQISEHLIKYNLLGQNVDAQKKQRQAALAKVENTKKLLHKEQELEQKLREQLNNEGSLISFLRSYPDETWKQHIGKLINPAWLLKKGLSPKWEDQPSQNSFYGLHLELDKLSLPQEADSLEELKKRIEQQVLRCQHYQDDQARHERYATTAQEQLEDLELALSVSEQELNNLNRKSQEIEAAQERIESEIRLNIHERKERATQLLQDAEQQHNSLIQQHKSAKNDLQQLQEKDCETIKAAYRQKASNLEEQGKQIQENIRKVLKHRDDKIAELHKARDRALQAEGVDTQQLKNAEQRLADAQQKLKTVSGYIGKISAYHQWVEVELSQRTELHNHLKTIQEAIDHLEKEHADVVKALKQLDHEKIEHHKHYQTTLKLIQRKLQQLDYLLKRIEPSIQDFTAFESEFAINQVEQPLDFDWYLNHGQEQLSQLVELRKESLQLHTLVKQILSLAQGNGLEQYWSNQMLGSPHQVDSLPYMLEAMTVLSKMLAHEIPSKITATIAAYQSLGIVFQTHYESLKRFQRKVSRVSDDLSSNINTHNPFTALSEIEIRLEATIHKFGYLSDLENFVNKFESDVNEIPDESVIASLENAVNALHNSNVESHDLKTMVELSICFKENSRLVRVKNDKDLAEASSTGLSRLVILLIFTGLIRHLCSDESVAIHLPIDELGQIDPVNSIKLLELMQQQQVYLVCAQPQMTEQIARSFSYKYNIDKDKGLSQFVVKSKTQQNPLLVKGSYAQ